MMVYGTLAPAPLYPPPSSSPLLPQPPPPHSSTPGTHPAAAAGGASAHVVRGGRRGAGAAGRGSRLPCVRWLPRAGTAAPGGRRVAHPPRSTLPLRPAPRGRRGGHPPRSNPHRRPARRVAAGHARRLARPHPHLPVSQRSPACWGAALSRPGAPAPDARRPACSGRARRLACAGRARRLACTLGSRAPERGPPSPPGEGGGLREGFGSGFGVREGKRGFGFWDWRVGFRVGILGCSVQRAGFRD